VHQLASTDVLASFIVSHILFQCQAAGCCEWRA